MAIATLLNSFPQRAGNPDLLLRTFEDALSGIAEDIICDTARRFVTGQVEGQNLAFSPSVAEFTRAAKDLVEVRRARFAALPSPEIIPNEPIDRRVERVRCTYAGRKLIAENITYEKFKEMAASKSLPERCEFNGLLGAIYAA